METINCNLNVLYNLIWDNKLKDELCELNATVPREKRASLPLFLQLGEGYNKAELRIMYFGQEERPLKGKEFSEETTITQLFDYYKKITTQKIIIPKNKVLVVKCRYSLKNFLVIKLTLYTIMYSKYQVVTMTIKTMENQQIKSNLF